LVFMFTKFTNIRSLYIAMIFPWVSYDVPHTVHPNR
jgi:hypothetical protein